ncbi:MAG: DegT/DnrJ/EryC1/StrS family aminotransferase [Desulfobaccales bacterium]
MSEKLPPIPVAKPTLGDAEAAAARRAILSGWVVMGPEVAAFEQEFAAVVGAPRAVACSSGTAALHLALMALDLGPGDEVITVSHSFIATANAVRYVGATPVFVDVEPETGNINPDLVPAAITSKTKAILAVHQLGLPCNLAKLLNIARQHHLHLIEDAACALGSEICLEGEGPGVSAPSPPLKASSPATWELIGRPRGVLATFSFHPRKVITTGDGGMITGADPALMERLAQLRTHSMSLSTAARHQAAAVVFEQYLEVGYNYRLSDIQGAVGREQLKRLPGLVAALRRLARRYQEHLAGHPCLALPQEPPWARSNWQAYWITLTPACPLTQVEVMQALKEQGIHTRRGVMCAHREPAYQGLPLRFPLPVSERLQDRSIILPLYAEMTDRDQDRVISALEKILRG